jgi:hypothetical protein
MERNNPFAPKQVLPPSDGNGNIFSDARNFIQQQNGYSAQQRNVIGLQHKSLQHSSLSKYFQFILKELQINNKRWADIRSV